MPAIKNPQQIAQKWARVTPQRASEYQEGVNAPRTDWATATAAASERYKMGIQEAIAKDRFSTGVKKAGTQKWQRNASQLGPTRFQEGVQAAEGDYAQGFAPYAEVIERTTLPPRYAKGDPRNLDRVKVMSQALRKAKVGA